MYQFISFYAFADIADPEALRDAQRELCQSLQIFGRIYVAHEGINGTAAGPTDAIAEYCRITREIPGFEHIDFKEEDVDNIPFGDLRVRTRPHLVNLGEGNNVDPHTEGGARLNPHEWKAFFESGRKFTLLDVRNDYEAEIGRFKGAIIPPYKFFYDFPKWADELDLDPEEPVLMYCTGGIRCEKFSGLLKRRGHKEVYQLDGGILRYAADVGGDHYEGEVFVFDDRMSVDIGGAPTPGRCKHCGEPSSRMINCANVDCHELHISCDHCVQRMKACCTDACQDAPRVRVFDPSQHLYRPWRRLHTENVKEDASANTTQTTGGAQ